MAADVGALHDRLVHHLDHGRVGWRYWLLFGLIGISSVLEFFDFFIVGFIVAMIGPAWKLTFAESSVMLLSGGVGTIVGALVWGGLADKIGRRPVFLGTAVVCGAGSLALTFVPEGSWLVFSGFRLLIGFGVGGAAAIQMPYISEFTPIRLRSILPGLLVALASIGILAASASTALLIDLVGWRGLAGIGAMPLVLALVAWFVVPESVRWLLAQGRDADAESVARRFSAGLPPAAPLPFIEPPAIDRPVIAQPDAAPASIAGRFSLVFVAWFGAATAFNGIYLWGPTVLGLSLGIGVAQAAGYFVFISLAGVTGKLVFAFLPNWAGRRPTALIGAWGGTAALAIAAFSQGHLAAGLPLMFFALVLAAFFIEGGFANMAPYTNEMFPVRQAGRAMGLAQGANGLGKIAGSLSLAVIAGMGATLTPMATEAAVRPGFLLLCACAALPAIAFLLYRIETHGRSLALR